MVVIHSKCSVILPLAHLSLLIKCLTKWITLLFYLLPFWCICVQVCACAWGTCLWKCCSEVRDCVFSSSSSLPPHEGEQGLVIGSPLLLWGPVWWLHLSRAPNRLPALSVAESAACERQHNNTHCVDSTQVSGLFPSTVRPICPDTGLSFTNRIHLLQLSTACRLVPITV